MLVATHESFKFCPPLREGKQTDIEAIMLQQIERPHAELVRLGGSLMEPEEIGIAAAVRGDDLAVDDHRLGGKALEGVRDALEPVGEMVAVLAEDAERYRRPCGAARGSRRI